MKSYRLVETIEWFFVGEFNSFKSRRTSSCFIFC